MEFQVRRTGRRPISDDENVVLSGQRLVGADFGGRHLQQFSAEGSTFEGCRFDSAVIDFASFGAGRSVSEYVGCSFDGSKLRMGPGGYARFISCTFEDAVIEHWFCFGVELVDCTFSGKLKKVVFNGEVPRDKREVVNRRYNQFENNDFSRARLNDVSFRTGIVLTKQQLPTGDEYRFLQDAPAAVKQARVAFNAWNDPESKKRVRGILAVMEEDVAAGQLQLLVRVDDYPRNSRPAIRSLLDAAEDA